MSVVHGSVVVGVDGSESAAAALDWAVRQVSLEGRTLTVVHACGVPGVMRGLEDRTFDEGGWRTVGRAIVRDAVRDARLADPTIGVESVVTMGHAEQVLTEAAESAALLVVGARGRGTLTSALLGSVSTTLARQAHCPVVVVRQPEDQQAGAGQRRVVVGVDRTPASSAAVEFGFRMASMRGAPLTLLHAVWDSHERASSLPGHSSSHSEDPSEEEWLVAETVAGLREKYPDVPVGERYQPGEPVRRLVEASHDASLVVVGSRGRRLLGTSLLGSVSRGVAERAFSPVAVVRP